jgi:hypothetical protein
MSQYSINPVSHGLNNFFESLTNSSNPQYIQPINTVSCTVPHTTAYTPPHPISYTEYKPIQSQPLPTVTYTPSILRNSFEPLNSNYVNAYYGK